VVAARRGQAEALPVFLRFVAIPLAGALLFLLFLHLGFPYDRLAGRLAEQLGQTTRTQVRFGELKPRLSLRGPGLEAVGVTATPAEGAPIQIERAFLRPAWSLAWLRLRPALHIDLTGVDLASLPLAAALPQSSLQGQADLRLELVLGGEAPQAGGRFSARDGSLGLPGLPAPVPFTSFAGELAYGGENLLELADATLEGPLVSVLAGGSLGRGASLASSPLQLDLEITAQPGLQAPLQAAGIQLGPEGRKKLHLTGTPSRPEIR
jgi:hypothetical protein